MGSLLLWYNVIMGRGEVRYAHWNGANHDDIDDGIDADVADVADVADTVDRGDFHTRPRPQKEHVVAGIAVAASDVSPRESQGNSQPNRSAKRKLDMSSQGYGDLVDLLPPDSWNLGNLAVRSAYIAYLSSLLGETERALDGLCQSDEYLGEVAEYGRRVDEANDNCPVQPRLTRALQAEAQARRRIRALQEHIDKIRQLGDKSNNQQ